MHGCVVREGPQALEGWRAGKKGSCFPDETGCLLIFEGSNYYASKRHRKLERCEHVPIFEVWWVVLAFLNWSEISHKTSEISPKSSEISYF